MSYEDSFERADGIPLNDLLHSKDRSTNLRKIVDCYPFNELFNLDEEDVELIQDEFIEYCFERVADDDFQVDVAIKFVYMYFDLGADFIIGLFSKIASSNVEDFLDKPFYYTQIPIDNQTYSVEKILKDIMSDDQEDVIS
jgi:hypothetical protein